MLLSSPSAYWAPALVRIAVLAALTGSVGAYAQTPAQALAKLQSDTWTTRAVSLADLGYRSAVVLDGKRARHEFYVPVPRRLQWQDAAIDFDASYFKRADSTASVLIWVDGKPARAQLITDNEGQARYRVTVPATASEGGFVRLGIDWEAIVPSRHCQPEASIGNVLTISPETRFTYRYDSRKIEQLDDAIAVLPMQTTVMVGAQNLSDVSFDTAWRLGVELERNGRQVRVRALPAVGETVDLSQVDVPADLMGIAAFAAVSDKQAAHVLGSSAEIGALIVLGAAPVTADVVIADDLLNRNLRAAYDALIAQAKDTPGAAQALDAWLSEKGMLGREPLAELEVRLARLGARTVIAVGPGRPATGVLGTYWRGLLARPSLTAALAGVPRLGENQTLMLANLSAAPPTFDVLDRADWTATIPFSGFPEGRVPSNLVLDVAAAPGASTTPAVVSVFWNDILVSAKQLTADGRAERLSSPLPAYGTGQSNVVKVSFQRQPVAVNCDETPQGFPVSILPSSYITFDRPAPSATFAGVLPLLGGSSQLIVPRTYLDAAPGHLQRVIRVAQASGLSTAQSELAFSTQGTAINPSKPFLSMDGQVDGVTLKIDGNAQGRVQIAGKPVAWLDASGLDRLSAAQVVRANGHYGIVWHPIGQQSTERELAFQFGKGDAALIGETGPIAWVDGTDEGQNAESPNAGQPFYEWRRHLSWGLPALGIALALLLLLLVLSRMSRRKRNARK